MMTHDDNFFRHHLFPAPRAPHATPRPSKNKNMNNNKAFTMSSNKGKSTVSHRSAPTPRDAGARKKHDGRRRHQTEEERCSRVLSWALRHAAPELGLNMSSDGYVPVSDILNHSHKKFKGITEEKIRRVVASNDKQRFSLKETEDGTLCIRASQGHSIHGVLDPETLLTKLSQQEVSELPVIVHGTYRDPWQNAIRQQGLSRMKRTHIHFAPGLPSGKDQVISGMRRSCDIYIFVDGKRCAQDNIVFYRSDNGVLLTAGVNEEGVLPPSYFSHVVASSGEVLLDNREKE
jgi:2'-phosphotransferase